MLVLAIKWLALYLVATGFASKYTYSLALGFNIVKRFQRGISQCTKDAGSL